MDVASLQGNYFLNKGLQKAECWLQVVNNKMLFVLILASVADMKQS